MTIHFQDKNTRGNYAGHCTGHGFTIVWCSRPIGDFIEGVEVIDILSVCIHRLDYLVENNVATDKEKKAMVYMTMALDVLENDMD